MVICLSITGMLCKHDIVLDIRRLLKNRMRLLKKSPYFIVFYVVVFGTLCETEHTQKKNKHLITLNREVSLYKAEKTI